MIRNKESFAEAIRSVLLADAGLSIESEGDIFIRSLDSGEIAAGSLCDDGGIAEERVYPEDQLDAAIAWFIAERGARNHGTPE